MKFFLKARATDGAVPPHAPRFAFLRTVFSRSAFVAFAILASAALRFWAESQSIPLRQKISPATPSSRIAINQVDQAILESLPGIGLVLAKRIIEDRRRNGPYRRPDDLLRISGFGQARVDGITPYIRFDLPTPKEAVEIHPSFFYPE